jgi:phosphoribosylformimino-5-aminoimidazole carboxamide ribotide isomerase
MLIPSIDLQGGRIVQLVQGERLAIETDAIDEWIERLRGQPKVQLIDLDAAKGEGQNYYLVERICRELSCRVGGGIRTVERAQDLLDRGAMKVIIGSALFSDTGVEPSVARNFADALGADRLIGAVDSRGGQIVIHGWRTRLPITAADAVKALEPFFAEFLYTHVDREGLMQGTDLDAIKAVAAVTTRRITAAGGITTMTEVDTLDAMGIDAVVGMALYTGTLKLPGRDAV